MNIDKRKVLVLGKRWNDSANDSLKKKGLDVEQGRRMEHKKNKWGRFETGNEGKAQVE